MKVGDLVKHVQTGHIGVITSQEMREQIGDRYWVVWFGGPAPWWFWWDRLEIISESG
jgi:hypothetical protein